MAEEHTIASSGHSERETNMTNLLKNSTFGSEQYDPTPGDISGLLPRDWRLVSYSRPSDAHIEKQDSDWLQPEIIPIKWKKQFPEWWLVYGANASSDKDTLKPLGVDPFVLKIFKGNAPTAARVVQTGDKPAGRYRFTCPIFPDQKMRNGDRPSPSSSDDWYLSSEVEVFINDGTSEVSTGRLDARSVRLGEYTALTVEKDHKGGELTVGFALRGRWGFENNGWFVDDCRLEKIDGAVAPTLPVVTPTVIPPIVTPPPLPESMKLSGQALFLCKVAYGMVKSAMRKVTASGGGQLPLMEAIKQGLIQLIYHPWETPK